MNQEARKQEWQALLTGPESRAAQLGFQVFISDLCHLQVHLRPVPEPGHPRGQDPLGNPHQQLDIASVLLP